MRISNHQNGDEYQSMFENAFEGIFQLSLDGHFIKVNPAMASIYGFSTPAEMILTVENIANQIYVIKEDWGFFLNSLQVDGHIEKFETQNLRRDGEVIWIECSAYIVQNIEGKASYVEGFLTDITSRKEIEIALIESEARYRALVERLPGIVLLKSAENTEKTFYVSSNIKDILGYSPEEWISTIRWSDVIHPEDWVSVSSDNRLTEQTNNPFVQEYRIRRKNGHYIWVKDETFLVREERGTPHYWQSFLFDISEQKQAENELQKNEEQFRKIFQANPIASCIATLKEGRFIAANDAYWKLSKFSPSEFLGRTSLELGFIDKSGREKIVKRLERERSIHNENGKLITQTGDIRDTLEFFELIFFDGQECILAMFYDITEKISAQTALQESEERFRLAFLTSPDAININRLEDGLYVAVNEGFIKITGYSRDETIGKTSIDIDVWENINDRTKLVNELRKYGVVNNMEAKFRMKDGKILTGLMSSSLIMLGGVPHIISITREIESIKRAEKTLQRQLQELTILHNIALASSSSRNLDELLQRVTDTIVDTLHPNNCGVELVTKSGDSYLAHPTYRGDFKKEIGKPVPLSKGVTGKVISTGKPIRLGNVKKESVYIEVSKDVQSELCVPIKIQGQIVGAINIESNKSDAYTESDERLLNTIAGTISTAMEKLNLFEAETNRRQQAETLLEATNALTLSLDLDTLLNSILERLSKIVPYESASIAMEQPNGELVIIAGRGFPEDYEVLGRKIGHSEKWLLKNASRQAYIVPDVKYEPTFQQWEGSDYIRGWMGVPMYVHDELLGYINLDSHTPNTFTEQDAVLAQTFANSAAVAIENARLFEIEQRNRERADTMREATAALTTSIDLNEIYDLILDSLSKLIPFENASIEVLSHGCVEVVGGKGKWGNKVSVRTHFSNITEKKGNIDALREAIIVPDIQKDERFEIPVELKHIHSWMSVPMIVHDQIIGYLNFDSTTIGFFTNDHANLAQIFSHQAAVAIENARLFAQEQAQRKRNAILLEILRIASSSLALEDVMQTILERLIELVPATSGTIQMLEGKKLCVKATLGFNKDVLPIGKIISIEDSPLKQRVIKQKVPVCIEDTEAEIDYRKIPGAEYVKSVLLVPLIYKERAIGLISLDSDKEAQFTDIATELTLAVANHASIAIENARLFEAEQRRHRESETLRQAALAITTSLELKGVLEAILIVMKQVIPYDSACVILLEENQLKVTASQGFSNPEEVLRSHFPETDELFEAVRNSAEPIIIKNAQQDYRFKKWAKTDHVRGWMGVPLTLRNEVIGCITLDSRKEDTFNESLSTLAQAFANQAASAIQNARQFEAEQRHFQEAETLRQAAESVTSSLDIQQVLSSILENLNCVIPFDSAGVFLLENDKAILTAINGLDNNTDSIGREFPANNPLLQEMLQTHLPLVLDNASMDTRFENWMGVRALGWMGVPLITHGGIIGYFTLDSNKVGAYKEHDANLAMTFAHQAAVAIENARLYKRSEQQIRQLTVLRDIDNAIASSFNLRVTLNLLLDHTIVELNADAATILLYNSDLHSLSEYVSTGIPEKRDIFSTPIRIGEGLASRVVIQRKLVHILDIDKELIQPHNPPVYHKDFKSYIGIPLIGKGQIKGVLEIYMRNHFHPPADWINFLYTLAGQAAIAIDNSQLFKNLQRSNQELTLAYDTTLEGWGRALELRDKETQGHTSRVAELTLELAQRVGVEGEDLTHIMRGTLLHDIGKMGIPDSILHKPGKLTKEEWDIMRQHPQHAYDLLNPIPYLRPSMEIPYFHHEHWDGNGYPQGLKGEEIPLAARIFAVIDVWDALLYERPYREAWPEEKVIEQIKIESGTKLDPAIVEKFLEMIKEDRYKQKRADLK